MISGRILTVLLLSSCVAPRPLDRAGPAWNVEGIWKPAPGMTHAFVPWDLPRGTRLESKQGEWVADPLDGYRFFIPNDGTQAYTAAILRTKVQKVTNPYSREDRWKYSAGETVRVPLAFATVGVIRPKSWGRARLRFGGGGTARSVATTDDDDDDWPNPVEEKTKEPASRPRGISPDAIATPPPTTPVADPPEVVTRPDRP